MCNVAKYNNNNQPEIKFYDFKKSKNKKLLFFKLPRK